MNLFFAYKDGTIVTPELSGTILEGVTRCWLIELAKWRGGEVSMTGGDIAGTCATPCWTSSTAAPRTPTAGCTGWSECACRHREGGVGVAVGTGEMMWRPRSP